MLRAPLMNSEMHWLVSLGKQLVLALQSQFSKHLEGPETIS